MGTRRPGPPGDLVKRADALIASLVTGGSAADGGPPYLPRMSKPPDVKTKPREEPVKHDVRKDPPRVRLDLDASVYDTKMFLREQLGEAKVEDGTKVEVSMNMAGASVLVTHYAADGKTWRTYAFGLETFVAAVLRHEAVEDAKDRAKKKAGG